jgi:hypothetical protein
MRNKTNKTQTVHKSRRAFAKSVAASLIAAPMASSLVQAQTATPTPTPSPTPTPARPSPVVEAYMELTKARFGEFVTDEQMDQIKRDLEGNARTTERFRAVKLKNSDEPDFVFSA